MAEIGCTKRCGPRARCAAAAGSVPDAVLRRVIEAATWAPSGGNRHRGGSSRCATRRRSAACAISTAAPGSATRAGSAAQLEQLSPESRARGERMLRAADYLAEHLDRRPVMLVFCFHPELLMITDSSLGRPSVVGGASVYPAVQNLLLACRAEGLGCVLTTLLCMSEPEIRTAARHSRSRGPPARSCRSAIRSAAATARWRASRSTKWRSSIAGARRCLREDSVSIAEARRRVRDSDARSGGGVSQLPFP